jgi:hypothetical protein
MRRRFVNFPGLVRPVWVGLCILGGVASAPAQDLDRNKTPSQLFSSNCTACHRSPQGLAKNLGASGLPSFLRQHYTTGPGMASSLAGFLIAAGDAPPRAARAAAATATDAPGGGRRPGETQAQRRAREAAVAKDARDAVAHVRARQPGEPATVSSDPEPVTIAIAPTPVAPDPTPRPARMAPPAVSSYVVLQSSPAAAESAPAPAAASPANAEPPTRTAAVPSAATAPVAGVPSPDTTAAAPAPEPLGPDAEAQAIADQSGFAAPLP